VWSVGSAGRVLIPAATDTLWITALLDPERLADTAKQFAETCARRRVMKALLRRVQVTAHWLWAGMPHSHALSVVNHTHAEAAFALHEPLRGISSVGADLKDHLAAWMSHVPGHHAATGPDFIVHHVAPDGSVYAPDPTDAAAAIGVLVAMSLLQHGRRVYKGDKTMLEAAADGSTEVAVKYAGGFVVVTIVHVVVHHLAPGVGTFCVVVGRWAAIREQSPPASRRATPAAARPAFRGPPSAQGLPTTTSSTPIKAAASRRSRSAASPPWRSTPPPSSPLNTIGPVG
jgi:hypothetical protein